MTTAAHTNRSRAFGLLSYFESENLGDEIQSIAAARFLPQVDANVDRDHLHRSRGRSRPLDVILNGWFLIGHEWPPPAAIRPLLVSFYAPPEHTHLYDRRHLEWYRQHQPIGCRSTSTLGQFEAMGVEAYFSGCLTLTLPAAVGERGDDVCIVDCDPDLLQRLVPARVLERARFLTHVERSDARALWRRVLKRGHRTLYPHAPELIWRLSAAYRHLRHVERVARAQTLLDRYARARLVITGRLHCFLPCLALGTPVVLLNSVTDPQRLDGLAQLGRVYTANDDRIEINWEAPEPNPDRHRAIATALTRTCSDWVAQS